MKIYRIINALLCPEIYDHKSFKKVLIMELNDEFKTYRIYDEILVLNII